MMEETSAFFSNPSAPESGVITTLTPIHRSAGGACALFRVERQGKFRVLKCLKEEYRGDALYEGLLRKEFDIGRLPDHPNICHYYSFSQQEVLGNCIEMEWVHGRTLEQALKEETFNKADADRIIGELCDALSCLHSRQILHRDLTPANVMLTFSGNNVRLIDFGFSDSDEFSILKTPAGTRGFTAPEVLEGQDADIRSEIWSLGKLIALITRGRRYHSVVRRCCAADPAARFASVDDVRKAIQIRRGWIPWAAFCALFLALGLLAWQRSLSSGDQVESPRKDTVIVLQTVTVPSDPAPNPPSERPRPTRTPAPASSATSPVDSGMVDEIFRQATDLFN